ncbi:Lsr2 dimerization domain-containing protein [Nocardia terpenica]|uniref:Lsr2 dimerization domain-containing protein n=1 Tax=Nocardia terpenica TaxID=455432 RepID=A0A6G9ZCX9_9NOCA|nr:histone-like nucleoid-structuring protein Lsr2 [Nocardia terpenica]QIS23398.1 hypothetical protein F6W96_38760 [Nocardia terpenica]
MTRQVVVTTVDDYDGSAGAETVAFAFEGVDYEIGLSHANAEQLREFFGQWTPSARKLGRARRRAGTRTRKKK